MSQQNKVYCTCKGQEFIGASLQGCGESKLKSLQESRIVWVQACCYKPSEFQWEEWKDTCENCLRVFSSPFEIICKSCAQADPTLLDHPAPWHGWAWARGVQQAWLRSMWEDYSKNNSVSTALGSS